MDGKRSTRVAVHRLLSAALVALAACDSPTVPEGLPTFDPRYLSREGVLLLFHWPLGRTINVYVDSRGAPGGLDLAEAVRVANAQWRAVVLYREFDVRLVPELEDADVLFRFDAAPPLLLGECPADGTAAAALAGSAGVTAFRPDESRGVFLPFTLADGGPSRIKFEVTITSDLAVLGSGSRLLSIVGHELGHVLGIGNHSLMPTDLMNSSPQVPAPGPGDARTLRYLLHQPPDMRL